MTEAIALLIAALAFITWVPLLITLGMVRARGIKPPKFHSNATFWSWAVFATAALTWFNINHG